MRALFDNLALKGLSLGLAALLWWVIAGETTSEIGLTIPVELQSFPRELELTGDVVTTVDVRLRGSPGLLQGLAPREVSAHIDLSGFGEGEHIVHLTEEAVRVPFGAKVVHIAPSLITLNLERTVSKTVPVRPRLTGRPATGLEVAEVIPEPAEVRISGPESRVQDVESAFTEPVSVEGARESVTARVNIGLADPLLRLDAPSPRVRVTARLREAHQRRTVPGLRIEVRGAAAMVRPATVDVVLSGPASVLSRLDAGALRAYVEAARVGRDGRAPVAVEIRPGFTGVTVEETHPAEVAVRGRSGD
jgi:YbbR domain-containing protein